MERVRRLLMPGLRHKPLVAAAHVAVRDQGGDPARRECLQVRLTVIAGVGRDHGVRREQRVERRYHRHEQRLFRARPVRLRVTDDLMRAVDGGHTCVPLDHALARRHLRTLIVRPVALADRAA